MYHGKESLFSAIFSLHVLWLLWRVVMYHWLKFDQSHQMLFHVLNVWAATDETKHLHTCICIAISNILRGCVIDPRALSHLYSPAVYLCKTSYKIPLKVGYRIVSEKSFWTEWLGQWVLVTIVVVSGHIDGHYWSVSFVLPAVYLISYFR